MKYYLTFILYFAIQGCALSMGQSEQIEKLADEKSELISFVGKIVYLEFEGGFWGIIGENGGKYDPLTDLGDEFKVVGTQVKGKLRLRKGMVHFHMWGKLVELVDIQIIQ